MSKLTGNLTNNAMLKYKNIMTDMGINIIATLLPVLFLQFVILPVVAQKNSGFDYGLMITLVSLVTLSTQSFSVSLGTSRLLLNQSYIDKKVSGDFNLILIVYCLANNVLVLCGTIYYDRALNIINVTIIVLFSLFQFVNKYLLVSFRIELNYKAILINNGLLLLGYLIGMILFLVTNMWQLIFLTGEIVSLLYVLSNTKLLHEPIKRTGLFKGTVKQVLIILIASFLGTATSQIDKLLIFPILGANMASTYYVSTLLGKTILLLATPASNVMLTYLSKMKSLKVDSFKWFIVSVGVIGTLNYFAILLISRPILTLIYPMYVDQAMNIVYITTLTSVVLMIGAIVNPVIVRFCDISWQIWTNLLQILVFFFLIFFVFSKGGIFGFCIASLIAAMLKLVLVLGVYIRNHKAISIGDVRGTMK